MAGRPPELTGRLQKPLIALVLGLCTLAVLAPAGEAKRAPTAHVSAAPPLGGVNVVSVGPDPLRAADQAIAQARALHAQVVRTVVSWSALEPRGPSQIEPRALAFADRLVGDAAASGIRVIMTVYSTPCWASSAPASLLRKCSPGSSSKADAWPPSNPSTYAAFVAYLAQRYGTRLAAIEIWNEPDQINEDYFAGPNKAVRYAALLRATYPAIKQANPNVPVIAGSLVGSNGVFLRALYAAGIKGYYDGLAVHFYTLTLAALRSFREVQVANGDTAPLWLDEFGWSSCWPRYRTQQEQACVTPQVQATNITNLFRSLARTPYVAADVLYQLQGSRAENFGVLNEHGARKPSYTALSRVLASPFGSPSPVTLSLRRRGSHVVAGGSGPVGDFMQLEAFQGNTLRYRATFTLNRFNRYSIALPSVLGTSGLRVRVYQEWMGPGRAAQRSI
ncbi:MAG: cellulase family glycosylhydrolase [Solirubrobacteraceae bacterium]